MLTNDGVFSSRVYQAIPVHEGLYDRVPAGWRHAGQVVQGRQTINMDAPHHTQHRRALQQTFKHQRVHNIEPDIAGIADELIAGLVEDGACDLVQDFALQLTLRFVTSMMAVPRELSDGFLVWIRSVFAILAPVELEADQVTVPDDDLVSSYEKVYTLYSAYLRFLEEREAKSGDDFTSTLLTLRNEDGT